MTLHAVFLPLLLLSTAIAQDSAPVDLTGNDHVPICRGKDTDVPGCITAPHATYSPDPEYPKKESKAHRRGTVVLDLVVDADGLPRDIKVYLPLSPEFDEAALDAVKKWKFSPATRDGKPIATQIKVEVSFHLY
jgi:TonB family protein